MLELKNIIKDYYVNKKPLHVLKNLNVSFPSTQFVTILGPSGCGKTTLLNLIGGLDQYTDGDLLIEGKSTKAFKDKDWDAYRNHRVGFVFQSYNLITHLTVLENVAMSLTLTGTSQKERTKRATDALISVGLESELHKRTNQLSGGQMQRVAIARALVNDPNIILADEPTGALDSNTSVQVMNILKEVSKTRLVIMVSHNETLANEYSDRIIKMVDGNIVSDSLPYISNAEETKVENEQNKKTSMPFTMALRSSFKNILTKKGRTIMTAVAGSLGIIGVTLVAALSTGFNGYIKSIETNTMASYPLSVFSSSIELNADTFKDNKEGEFPTEEVVNVVDSSDPEQSQLNYYFNNFSPDFMSLVDSFKTDGLASTVMINYPLHAKMITQRPDNVVVHAGNTSFSALSAIPSGTFTQLPGDLEFMEQYYDLIGSNSRFPANKNEVVLIIDKYNQLTSNELSNLGIINPGKVQDAQIKFDDIIGKQYTLLGNNDYYTKLADYDTDTPPIKQFEAKKSDELKTMFEDENVGIKVEIVGVLRPNKESTLSLVSNGLGFTKELNNELNTLNAGNDFAKAFEDNIIINGLDDFSFYSPLKQQDGGKPLELTMTHFLTMAKSSYFRLEDISDSPKGTILKTVLSQTKYSNIESIAIFPVDSSSKVAIKKAIDNFNKDLAKEDQIIYLDLVATITDALATMVDIIAIVLLIFTSISLVVSSVLIGIITYISVIERTKEIGVLRAIGARKKDISRLFTAETVIIGALAGVLGVTVGYLMTIPTNIILNNLFPDQNIGNIANLAPHTAILLVVFNIALTIVAGALPSRYAANKNPVEALRTE